MVIKLVIIEYLKFYFLTIKFKKEVKNFINKIEDLKYKKLKISYFSLKTLKN